MIDRTHGLPVTKQARALGINRGSVYSLPRPVPAADLAIMRRMDELPLEFSFAGSRMLRDFLNREGIAIGRRHVTTLMRRMGIEALYRKPNTSKPAPLSASLTSRRLSALRSVHFAAQALRGIASGNGIASDGTKSTRICCAG